MNETVYLVIILVLLPFAVMGIPYFVELLRKNFGYSRILILEKDGTHTVKWIKAKSKKEVDIDERKRSLDPRGRFIGPLGNLFVFVADKPKPITPEGENTDLDTDDISTMVRLSYFAGKMAGVKDFKKLEILQYLTLGTLVLVGLLLAMYWQDRATVLKQLGEAVARLRTLNP